MGASQERGDSHYVPGTGEKLVRLRPISPPVPGTFTPKMGRTRFHYSVRNDHTGHGTIIRPHFIKNDQAGYHALGHERLAVRRAEVGRMFTHIHAHVPLATTVLGNSWLYNLAAYQRVYPPAYTLHLPAIQHDEFQYLSLWGQCFDRHWQPKTTVTAELLRRLDLLADLADLRSCFPYAVRRPQCGIGEFYSFFAINHKE